MSIVVQDSFFASKSSGVTFQHLRLHILKNAETRKILQYLTADGRHSAMSNLDIIYQDALTRNPSTYVENFDDLVGKITDPIYSNRFSWRRDRFGESHEAFRIETLDDCSKYGPDCMTALALLESTLKMFYRVFSVLNKEFDRSMASSNITWERYYGTMIANMNFQFDVNYEETWKLMKTLDIESPPLAHVDIPASHLQNDLVRLLDLFVPSNNISLPDFLGLMGYSNEFGMKNYTLQNNAEFENDTDCSAFDKSFRATCRKLNVFKDLHPLPTLDPLNMDRTPCDLGKYLEKWIEYWNSLKAYSMTSYECKLMIYTFGLSHILLSPLFETAMRK